MIFKNKYNELRSGWMLIMAILVYYLVQVIAMICFIVIAALTGRAGDIESLLNIEGLSISPIFNSIIYPLMICAMFLLFWSVYKRPIRQIGFYSSGWFRQLLFGGLFGIVLIIIQISILLISGTGRIKNTDFSGLISGYFWSGLLLFIYVGFFEEILSRGIMMTALKTTRNKWVIILLPSVLFGFMHIFNNNVTVFSLVNIMLAGVLFSYLLIKTGRLWAPIGLHITWNFFMGNVFGIPVSGNSFSAIINIQFIGPDWLTGGAFGLEGGALCTLAIASGLIFTHFCIKQSVGFWDVNSYMPLQRGPVTAIYLDNVSEGADENVN